MLPSTGYFNAINCPFYDSGLCERPYCHFRHVKRDPQNICNDGFENETIVQLVSQAVKKVLQQADAAGPSQPQKALHTTTDPAKGDPKKIPFVNCKPTYNPTPISELNKINNTDTENNEESSEQKKRHIPVPYTPQKPATLPIKRPIDTNGSSKPFIYIPPTTYTPGSTENVKLDPYLPKGAPESTDKYLPGSEIELQAYVPIESKVVSKVNYVPSDKKRKILEYKPTKVAPKCDVPKVTYQPTPLPQVPCFSSDEEEPVTKKLRLSAEINNLDDLETEFQLLGQILDEEKTKDTAEDSKRKELVKVSSKSVKNRESTERKNIASEKKKDKSSNEKSNTASSNKRSSHKSSHKDKYTDKNKHKSKDKKSDDSKRHNSSSKTSESKSSKNHTCNSPLSSDKDSRHFSKSKSTVKIDDRKKDKEQKESKSYKHKHDSKKKLKDKSKVSSKNRTKNVSHDDNDVISDDVDAELMDELAEPDEESIQLECIKIFQEAIPIEKKKNMECGIKSEIVDEDYISTKKRISRTIDKNVKVVPRKAIKPDYKVNAAQTLVERVAKIKNFHASKQATPTSENLSTAAITEKTNNTLNNTSSFSTSNNSKIRIAHVPYASYMLNSKREMTSRPVPTKPEPCTSTTIVQTVKKGSNRVAHMPNDKFIDRPGVLEPLASKIPANVRSTYLNMMIDECLKIYLTATDAYDRSQHEELNTSKKCTTVQIYKNSAVLTINRLRKEIKESNGEKKSASDCSTLNNLPNKSSNSSTSWSIENKNRKTGNIAHEFTGAKFYENINKWVLTEEQLQENGFPRPHPSGEKGRAKIYNTQTRKQKPPKGIIRTCSRCKQDYNVDKKGFAADKQECIYHPNNKYKFRGEARYQCCGQDGFSDGCCIAPCHVYEYVDYENLKGYMKTFPPDREMDDYGVYALDCEMCYTTHGLDLTRVTVIDSSCKVVYETLIKPFHPIIDYNTRYSGITEEQMADVKTTLLEVQATLLSMFNSNTILIGHSLESDFKALKLIHDTVIDTSVLYPHKMGPPLKRALRNLSSEYLKKIIQNSVDGHDSAEDATVCMELIHFRLREYLKTR